MPFKIIEPPQQVPVCLEMVKIFLRIQHEEEDEFLHHLIKTATQWIQDSTGKSLLRQTCQFTHTNQHVFLPFGPILNVREVKIRGKALNPTQYTLDSLKGTLTIEVPILRRAGSKAVVTYEAGFGDSPQDVPDAIKNAILTAIAYLYEHRDASHSITPWPNLIKPWVQYHKEYHLV